jgi:hypothetical protein
MEYKIENKNCQNCKKDFMIEVEDFNFYEKIGVPTPTWCPRCRFLRKLVFTNERSLYKRNCGNCNSSIISMYGPESNINAWCPKCYLSDSWDARDYAKEYDFSRPFFEQYKELKYSIPHRALDQNEKNAGGCEYSNYCFGSKNVYLSFNTHKSENIKYSNFVLKNNKNCLDCLIVKENEKGYELIQSIQNYNSTFLVESDQCIDSHFLYDCSNCSNCCLSSNIRNKSFVFKNKQLSKEEYLKQISVLELHTYSGQLKSKEEFEKISKGAIHRYAHIKNSVNAVGDFIENSKNVYNCYGLVGAENVKNVFFGMNVSKDSQDMIFSGIVEECYEFTYGGRGASRVLFSFSCGGGSRDLFYCDSCRGCSDCFGCVSLNKKQYCIFNKQYTKEEYFEMIKKIKSHMNEMPYVDKVGREYAFGECFPPELSPFAYNETSAFEEEPLSKTEALNQGYKWKDKESKFHAPSIKSEELKDSINDVGDAICNEIIECPNNGMIETQCTFAYKILNEELSFYRQMNLPLPRYCPNCRYHKRLIWKNQFIFYKRECMCEQQNHEHEGRCVNDFETMYAPERQEIVYCKQCYQKEVY